ncbi:MAG: ABC transporter ATP-binding protein [Lachnospiraceae bacterium]|nr:ABC transporter ATP-binding protein [Lachnospiraceae bacterium]
MIEVKNLVKTYGENTAVKGISFKADDRAVYGLLGPNGAGKTTTLNIMAGILCPTDGDVIINGTSILDDPKGAAKSIGYLPEVPPLYPDMTPREYLRFAAALKKVPAGEAAGEVGRVMSLLELDEVENRLMRSLSKGFRQRCGIAQALIGDPEILILDEPVSGLDPRQIIGIRELIRELGRTHTVLLSSHMLSEASEVCDRILIMSEGRLVADDTYEGLLVRSGRTSLESVFLELTESGRQHAKDEQDANQVQDE